MRGPHNHPDPERVPFRGTQYVSAAAFDELARKLIEAKADHEKVERANAELRAQLAKTVDVPEPGQTRTEAEPQEMSFLTVVGIAGILAFFFAVASCVFGFGPSG